MEYPISERMCELAGLPLIEEESISESARTETHVEVKELPDTLRSALKKVGFRGRDIRVVAVKEIETGDAGGSGRRGFTVAVNIATGRTSEIAMGSWGGPNPFERKPVDDLDSRVKIPPNSAIIKGSEGGGPTWATIYVNPDSLTKMLPGGDEELSDREKDILGMMNFKSAYKKELLSDNKVTKEELEKLAKSGHVKINKAGASSLTAKGRNSMNKRHF